MSTYKNLFIHEKQPFNQTDINVIEEVRIAYFPDIINYSQIRSCIDVGAHIGSFTCYLKENNPDCHIYCIEPEVSNYELLIKNTEQFDDIICFCGVVSYIKSSLLLIKDTGNSGGHHIIPVPFNTDLLSYTLEELMQDEELDLLKLDCEGSEEEILRGANPETLSRIKFIVGEFHKGRNSLRECTRHLENFELITRSHYEKEIYPRDLGYFVMIRK